MPELVTDPYCPDHGNLPTDLPTTYLSCSCKPKQLELPDPGDFWIWMPDNPDQCEILQVVDVVANANPRGPFIKVVGNILGAPRWSNLRVLNQFARPARHGEVSA